MKVKLLYILAILALSAFCFVSSARILECYSCDSNEDVECATKPGQQINVEECAQPTDACVTAIAAGITRRGCRTRLFPTGYCPEPCESCNSSLCNRHIFPADRLHCYQCVGADCINVSNKSELIMPCPVYNEKDRCYTNVIGISNVQRGCERTNLPADCPNVCLKCDYNGCNNELGVYEQSCLQCTHNSISTNPSCLRSIQTANNKCSINGGISFCKNKVLHGHASKCFSYINEQTGVVQRGCSTTMGFFPTGNVTQCFGENCNKDCFGISCNVCNSTTDGYNCRFGRNLRAQKCADDATECFSCEAGSKLRRGCVDANFVPQSDEICYKCHDLNGCNQQTIRSCYHCNSLQQPDCEQLLQPALITQRNCSAANELCVSTIMRKFDVSYTLRGCASTVIECTEADPFCLRCNGSLCNNQALTPTFKYLNEHKITALDFMLRSEATKSVLLATHAILLIFIMMLLKTF